MKSSWRAFLYARERALRSGSGQTARRQRKRREARSPKASDRRPAAIAHRASVARTAGSLVKGRVGDAIGRAPSGARAEQKTSRQSNRKSSYTLICRRWEGTSGQSLTEDLTPRRNLCAGDRADHKLPWPMPGLIVKSITPRSFRLCADAKARRCGGVPPLRLSGVGRRTQAFGVIVGVESSGSVSGRLS